MTGFAAPVIGVGLAIRRAHAPGVVLGPVIPCQCARLHALAGRILGQCRQGEGQQHTGHYPFQNVRYQLADHLLVLLCLIRCHGKKKAPAAACGCLRYADTLADPDNRAVDLCHEVGGGFLPFRVGQRNLKYT